MLLSWRPEKYVLIIRKKQLDRSVKYDVTCMLIELMQSSDRKIRWRYIISKWIQSLHLVVLCLRNDFIKTVPIIGYPVESSLLNIKRNRVLIESECTDRYSLAKGHEDRIRYMRKYSEWLVCRHSCFSTKGGGMSEAKREMIGDKSDTFLSF